MKNILLIIMASLSIQLQSQTLCSYGIGNYAIGFADIIKCLSRPNDAVKYRYVDFNQQLNVQERFLRHS